MGKTKSCKECGEQMNAKEIYCTNCGKVNKKPFYKKAWFWIIIIIAFLGIIASLADSESEKDDSEKVKHTVNKKVKVTVIDMSEMTNADIDTWCNENKINCIFKTEYSDTIDKDAFIKQSVAAEKNIYEGEKIYVYYSLGKEPTKSMKNALKKAESYSETFHMSKQGIYEQLTSEYGEGFTKEEAQYAIDNLNVNYNENALEKAKSYQDTLNMSKKAIYEQLISKYGEGFTKEEAQYAIDHLDD